MSYTVINGIGLWNSWKRNFKTPLLACLDLLDNSFDASLGAFSYVKSKRIDHKPTQHDLEINESDKMEEETHDTDFQGKIHLTPLLFADNVKRFKTGIRILNNSSKPIKPLVEILEVYRSDKGKHTDSVGENGVGLKQGCATLSDLSFVISKNHVERILELGVIAADLQTEEGVRLPSFRITYEMGKDDNGNGFNDSVNLDSIKDSIMEITKNDVGVISCIKQLGNDNFDAGLDELLEHCVALLSAEWGNNGFCVILSDMRHGEASDLLEEVKQQIPLYYIHIPHDFDFLVGDSKVFFDYWQTRLVELSSFQVFIDNKTAWTELLTKDGGFQISRDGYLLNIYAGFNPLRTRDHGACSLFVYSRRFGRLIKDVKDARASLKLNATGTLFCQGLTIIVDDVHGYLPLSPSKQDIAFGEEQFGRSHEMNLMSWSAACAHLFWKHHAKKFGDDKETKTKLSKSIMSYMDQVKRDIEKGSSGSRESLGRLNITKFQNISWKHFREHIRANHGYNKYDVKSGTDTKYLIKPQSEHRRTHSKSSKQLKERNDDLEVSISFLDTSYRKRNIPDRLIDEANSETMHRRTTSKRRKSGRKGGVSGIFLSNEDKNWAKAASRKGSTSSKKGSSQMVADMTSSNGTLPILSSVSHLQKKAEELEEEIARVKKDTETENLRLLSVYDENGNEIENLEKKIVSLDNMMKAMIESTS